MRRAIAPFILLLIILAGCEIEKDPADEPLDPSLHLTDGFCLLSNNRVVLNHYDIDYYDYSAHLIYLKDPGAYEEKFKVPGASGAVYADSSRIYDLSFYSAVSSYIQQGPVIVIPQIFYPDYTVPIENYWFAEEMAKYGDPREDPRIVEALEKYGQFRHGLQCKIASVQYNSPNDMVLELELWNEDAVNYYYWDPEKLGMERYHYVTNGLSLKDTSAWVFYTHQVEHLPPNSWDGSGLDFMSLLESDSSVILTISYEHFDEVPPGSYDARFRFPAPHFRGDREELDQENGRIWLGELQLYSGVVVE